MWLAKMTSRVLVSTVYKFRKSNDFTQYEMFLFGQASIAPVPRKYYLMETVQMVNRVVLGLLSTRIASCSPEYWD